MKLQDITAGLKYENTVNWAPERDVTDICCNSAKVTDGSAFVAITGFKSDGHNYIPDAIKKGAKVIVAERYISELDTGNETWIIVEDTRVAEAIIGANFYGRPAEKMSIIGITGTNGKTTVTYLVKHILECGGIKTGLIGTNQNMIGDRVIETGRTTPDSLELQKLFAEMESAGVECVVMEVSSHALSLSRVYGIEFEVGAFTNLTRDHLDFHKTMENYAAAKAKLFENSRFAVINTDDAYGTKMSENAACSVVKYGTEKSCDVSAQNIELHRSGVEFDACGEHFCLNIPGEFSVYNALCAIGICRCLEIPAADIAHALSSASGVKGRAEIVPTGNTDYTVMIDYAHTPDGIENILNTVRGFAKGRVIIVFGCGGDRDTAKRAMMGKIAGRLADFSIITSDNPRSEEPSKIIDMIVDGISKTDGRYTVVENRRDAIEYALSNAQKDDVIILAGKGHETYQILGSGTIHFDEREIVRDILGGKQN